MVWQYAGAPLRRAKALLHDLVVETTSHSGTPSLRLRLLTIAADFIRPVFVLQDIVEMRRLDLPIGNAREVRGCKEGGAFAVLPGATGRAILGADIQQHDVRRARGLAGIARPHRHRDRRDGNDDARAKQRSAKARRTACRLSDEPNSRHVELFLLPVRVILDRGQGCDAFGAR